MKLVHTESFDYFEDERKKSSDLAKSTLELFYVGKGMRLNYKRLKYHDSWYSAGVNIGSNKAANEKAFREKFKKQIQALIKKEPRVTLRKTGNWCIFYD